MTSIVDPVAHLEKRCTDMGMSQRCVQQLIQGNLDTMGKIAFAVASLAIRWTKMNFSILLRTRLAQ